MRMIQIQDNITEQKNLKDKLESEQEKLHVEYNKVSRFPTVSIPDSVTLCKINVLFKQK